MQALYLDACEGMTVLLDEPALRVTMPAKADRLFPLQRISRVVVSGAVNWQMDALLACAEQGITVVFLGQDGCVRGRWLGQSGERQALLQRLADLMARADGGSRYADWRLAMRRMAVRSAARRLRCHNWRDYDAARLESLLQRLRAPGWQPLYRHMRGLLFAQMVELLSHCGLDAQSELLQEQRLDLAEDFTALLFWDFEVALSQWRQQQQTLPPRREWVVFYESRSGRVAFLARGLLSKLHQWLIEVV